MRYSLQFLVMVMAFVAAYFAGRASLVPIIREHERRDVLQEEHIHSLQTASEKASILTKATAAALQRRRSKDELQQLELQHFDTIRELESARALPRLSRPEYLVPDRVVPRAP
jgi:hypothetical protein